jgi:hypothetical protein
VVQEAVMATIEIRVLPAYLCEHCAAIILPIEQMHKDGLRMVIRHQCKDGFVQDRFEHAIGLTRVQLVT